MPWHKMLALSVLVLACDGVQGAKAVVDAKVMAKTTGSGDDVIRETKRGEQCVRPEDIVSGERIGDNRIGENIGGSVKKRDLAGIVEVARSNGRVTWKERGDGKYIVHVDETGKVLAIVALIGRMPSGQCYVYNGKKVLPGITLDEAIGIIGVCRKEEGLGGNGAYCEKARVEMSDDGKGVLSAIAVVADGYSALRYRYLK